MDAKLMKPVEEMYVSAVDASSQDFDFGEGYGDTWETIVPCGDELSLEECRAILEDQGADLPDPNPWKMTREELLEELGYDEETDGPDDDVVGVKHEETTDELRAELIEQMNDEDVDGLDDWREAVSRLWDDNSDAYVPMMSYYYPIPGYDGDEYADQLLLDKASVALCLVRVNNEVVLALTGGGMDLSRGICLAYMVLGYLPPLHFIPSVVRRGVPSDTERNRWLIEGCLRSTQVAEGWARSAREDIERLRERMLAQPQT